jgi:hypothetical protein
MLGLNRAALATASLFHFYLNKSSSQLLKNNSFKVRYGQYSFWEAQRLAA